MLLSRYSKFEGDFNKLFYYQNYCQLFLLLFLVIIVAVIQVTTHLAIPEVIGFEKSTQAAVLMNPILKGNISEVFNNNTVQLNGTFNVQLSFIKSSYNDTSKQEDLTHYVSVMCPIRSPSIVQVESQMTNQSAFTSKIKENADYMSGILFCQATNDSHMLKDSSINEDLISLKVAVLDNSSCENFVKMADRIKEAFGC